MRTFFQQTAQAETFAKKSFPPPPDSRNLNTGFWLSGKKEFCKGLE